MSAPQAVLDAPFDDAPRRTFAAAVGGERGELVRAQLALALQSWGPHPPDAHLLVAARTRSERALAGHEVAWAGPIPAIASSFRYVRGFVERVVVDARTFVERGDGLFRSEPVNHVQLVGVEAVPVETLFATPWLDRVLALELTGQGLGDEGVQALVARSLPRLRWLSLHGNGVTMAGAEALASGNLPALAFVGLELEVVARPAGVDWDGRVLATELPPAGRLLVDKVGWQPWQRCDALWSHQWPPDLYDLVEVRRSGP